MAGNLVVERRTSNNDKEDDISLYIQLPGYSPYPLGLIFVTLGESWNNDLPVCYYSHIYFTCSYIAIAFSARTLSLTFSLILGL
jgi:hypothetical protein